MPVTSVSQIRTAGRRRLEARRTLRDDADKPVWQRRLSTLTIAVLVGYLSLNKSFAYLGIPALNVFIGEVLIVGAFVYEPLRVRIVAVLGQLLRPGPFHLLAWAIAAFLAYGLFQALYGRHLGYPAMSILRNLPFNYYVLYVPIGIAIGTLDRDLLRRFARALAWFNAAYGLIYLAVLQRMALTLPWQPDVAISGASGSAVAILGLMCYGRGKKDWYLYAANFFILFAGQVRGEWVGLVLAIVVWSIVKRNIRVVVTGAAVLALVFAVMSLARIEIPASSSRGGTVSATGIFARSIAPFNKDLAAQYSTEADVFAGTASWRENWWTAIDTSAHQDELHLLLGNGYGFELRSLVTYVEPGVRTPHSVYYYALGYSGYVGVALFGIVQLALAALLWRVSKMTRQPFGLVMIPLAFGLGLFGNFFETPFGAIPYYLIVGLALAPLAPLAAPVLGSSPVTATKVLPARRRVPPA